MAVAYLALVSTGSQRIPVNPAAGCDVPRLLARLAAPMLLVAGWGWSWGRQPHRWCGWSGRPRSPPC